MGQATYCDVATTRPLRDGRSYDCALVASATGGHAGPFPRLDSALEQLPIATHLIGARTRPRAP